MGPYQPVYEIRPERTKGAEKTIHHNNIHPCPCRPQPPPNPSAIWATSEPEAAGKAPVASLYFVPMTRALALARPEPEQQAMLEPVRDVALQVAAPEVQESPESGADEPGAAKKKSTRETRGWTPFRYLQ